MDWAMDASSPNLSTPIAYPPVHLAWLETRNCLPSWPMDQIVTIPELNCQPTDTVARNLGYDREGIAFLGLSRLKGVGFHTLKTLGGGVSSEWGDHAALANRSFWLACG
jgi:hypothetical protein